MISDEEADEETLALRNKIRDMLNVDDSPDFLRNSIGEPSKINTANSYAFMDEEEDRQDT
jgi:hypothetical protein